MRYDALPSPGTAATGNALRIAAAKAISEVQIAIASGAGGGGGKTKAAASLQAFFTACAAVLNSMVELVLPTGPFVRVSNSAMTITFSEAMDQGIPPLSAFSGTSTTYTAFVWNSATQCTITGTGFAVGKAITYTKPTSGYKLQDRAGNEVATFSTTLA